MRTSDLITRIKAQCPAFAMVDHALTSAAETAFPAALVTPSELTAEPDGTFGAGVHSQLATQTFAIFFMLRRAQDTALVAKIDELDDLTAQLRAALVGWQIDGNHTPMNLVQGMLDKFHTGIVCWREDYSTQTELRFTR